MLRLAAAALLVVPVIWWSSASVDAGESVQLTIPLHNGQTYRLRDLYAACNAKLGSAVDLQTVPDRVVKIQRWEKAALLLFRESGIIDVSLTDDSLILNIPDSEDDEVRRANRRRLERLLGISLSQWPEGMGLHLPANFDPEARTVLLVHGLESGLDELESLRRACRNSSIQPLRFNYPNDGPLAWSGDRLSQELSQLSGKHPELKVVIVAHSMGGLVVRQALEAPGNDPGCVTDVFFLGAPHGGSALAGAGHEWLEMYYQPLPGVGRLADGLGEAAVDLQPGSRFLTRLASYEPNREVRYFSAIGTKSFISETERQAVDRQVQQILEGRNAPLEQRLRWQRLFSLPEIQNGKGDGVVSIASARLDRATAEKLFACNHLDLLHLPGERPEDHEVFSWILNRLLWTADSEKP